MERLLNVRLFKLNFSWIWCLSWDCIWFFIFKY